MAGRAGPAAYGNAAAAAALQEPSAKTMAVWVPFDSAGGWDAAIVFSTLTAMTAVPDTLQAAINSGPAEAARSCIALR